HGERVGLQRRDHAVTKPELAHGHDREVLKSDPEYEREREVRDVLRPQRDTRDRRPDRQQHPLADHVTERTPGAAVGVADPHRHAGTAHAPHVDGGPAREVGMHTWLEGSCLSDRSPNAEVPPYALSLLGFIPDVMDRLTKKKKGGRGLFSYWE